ncbi:conserved hypothetical protein [Segniliparus rotundus DSM 44985]|uniref:J domain-containing protein n=1 Tax=Segniliparus rotundus (strain ATCC BAA-972 / CDC 1076 / CIP 108378 / DSM 44985 / JCM 13578) TaxID=640132 RepID=D6ZDN9_SEGRD|nr:hypothetical protein [Segniliparus rotundus]ADG99296.1 conserved hypothetical protein [Segniliparus rotundus DSM 44985]
MDARARRARRDAVRRFHPDAGGSAEMLIAALAAFEERETPQGAPVRARRTWRGRAAVVARSSRRRWRHMTQQLSRAFKEIVQ